MDIFNNREIAIGIWLLGFVAFSASFRSIRQSLHDIWRAIVCRQILALILLVLAYVAAAVLLLHEIGLWSTSQLKNTIFWTLSVAFVSMFRVPQIAEDESYFRNAIKDCFKIIAVLEFVIAFYTFSLFAELVIVPVVTFLVMLQAFSEAGQRDKRVSQVLSNVLAAFGCVLLLYACYMLAVEPHAFFQADTFSDFVLPIALTILFLPFLFAFSLYVQYETLFTRIQFLYKTDSERRRAKRAALLGLHVRTQLLKRWLRYVQRRRPHEADELRQSIRYVRTQAKNERNPPKIPICRGWSPYLAGNFLSSMGLETGDYFQDILDPDQWHSNSAYMDVGGGAIPNDMAYYIDGNEQCATRLKLVANVNDLGSARSLKVHFLKAIEELNAKALGGSVPSELLAAIRDEVPISVQIAGKRADFVKESWPSQRGHELRFCLGNDANPLLTEPSNEAKRP